MEAAHGTGAVPHCPVAHEIVEDGQRQHGGWAWGGWGRPQTKCSPQEPDMASSLNGLLVHYCHTLLPEVSFGSAFGDRAFGDRGDFVDWVAFVNQSAMTACTCCTAVL